jgi:hypothetical protein
VSPVLLPDDRDRLTGLVMLLMLRLPSVALDVTPRAFVRRLLRPRPSGWFPLCILRSLAERLGVPLPQRSHGGSGCCAAEEGQCEGEEQQFDLDEWMRAVACVMLSDDGDADSAAFRACAMCGAPGTLGCGRCLSARYCSADCQRAHWKLHKLSCTERKQPHRPVRKPR